MLRTTLLLILLLCAQSALASDFIFKAETKEFGKIKGELTLELVNHQGSWNQTPHSLIQFPEVIHPELILQTANSISSAQFPLDLIAHHKNDQIFLPISVSTPKDKASIYLRDVSGSEITASVNIQSIKSIVFAFIDYQNRNAKLRRFNLGHLGGTNNLELELKISGPSESHKAYLKYCERSSSPRDICSVINNTAECDHRCLPVKDEDVCFTCDWD